MIDQKAMEGGRIRAHSIHIDERQLMRVSGVKDVDSFNEQEVQLLTEAGALRIEGMGLHMTKLDLDAGQVILEGEIIALEYLQDFAQAILEDREPVSNGELGRQVVKVTYAAYISAQTGRRIELSEL